MNWYSAKKSHEQHHNIITLVLFASDFITCDSSVGKAEDCIIDGSDPKVGSSTVSHRKTF